jgi:hypothetical protein
MTEIEATGKQNVSGSSGHKINFFSFGKKGNIEYQKI